MGKKMSPVKTALIASCEKVGIDVKKHDSVFTLIHRLSSAVKTLYSAQTDPLPASYKAQAFVKDKYNGDLSKAGPEWKVGAQNKIKLMMPQLRNTKGGKRVRWVLFR